MVTVPVPVLPMLPLVAIAVVVDDGAANRDVTTVPSVGDVSRV